MKKLLIFIIWLFLTANVFPQKTESFPDKIHGYKVYQTEVSVQTEGKTREKNADLLLKFAEPKLAEFSLTHLTFEIDGELMSFSQSGKIDFLTFKDFQVNGLKVEVEDYKHGFEMKKNIIVKLPNPVKISIKLSQSVKGLYKEWRDSQEEWQISGRIWIFGKFKKAFMNFKRAVPVDIKLKIKNPLKKS